jgi:hypothetical protein
MEKITRRSLLKTGLAASATMIGVDGILCLPAAAQASGDGKDLVAKGAE